MIPQHYFDIVKSYYKDEKKAWDWWKNSNPEFGMFSPLAMVKMGKEKEVKELINKKFS